MDQETQPKGFDKARKTASEFVKDKEKAGYLLTEAIAKAERSQSKLLGIWGDLQTLFRLIRAWVRGEYTMMPWQSLIFAIAAVVYFVNPFDFIPDFIPGSGFLDDATVIGFVLKSIKRNLDDFIAWEAGQPVHLDTTERLTEEPNG